MGYMEVYKSWCDNMYFDEATRDELKSIANIFRCDIKASYDGCMFYSSQTSGSISQSVIVAFLDIHNQIRGRYE